MGQKERNVAVVELRLRHLSDALASGSPESWAPEAAALRVACESLPAGRLADRCRELEKLGTREEISAAQLILDGISEDVARLLQ